ncbi:MAG: roadblock/LC7 domain-containing protein [Nonomuraea sp.]|nr:roadblock/LC7 domain-containing protein [Nonomuraea sp.]NUP61409.1 roadblock/LC7 domain-containing protein [Nonomuraea sp.]NUP81725.1 roadblock/LC7 domain-containing protein [Nonomuraea sp.]NUS06814.1 roadblock/LC7 domain-containing protein [Nonomuraea sp.]NUT41634.1 roadblock/LC7 domain-containing protein [Thermoactinospora sp.]
MLGVDTCLAEVMAIPGALDAMLVDGTSGMAVAFSRGSGVDADRSAAALADALRATTDGLTRSSPGEVVRIDDMLVTTDREHHLLRLLETAVEGPLVIYVRLDPERSDPAMARHHLRAISSRLTS